MMIKMMLIDLRQYLRLKFFQSKWLNKNKHNHTRAMTIFPIQNVTVGKGTYGPLNIRAYNFPQEKLSIGHYCSIAKDVVFMLSGEHPMNRISTYPFDTFFFNTLEKEGISKGNIIVEDDVWFGEGTIILSGVTIHQGAVIGAHSVVTKDVPAYSVYAGNRIIKMRFPQEIVDQLIYFDFSKLDEKDIQTYSNLLKSDVTNDLFKSELWMKIF